MENNDSCSCCMEPIKAHRCLVILLYVSTIIISYWILTLPKSAESILAIFTTGAILATFGSAINSISSTLERDLYERVRLNIDIFYKDIYRQDQPWRRWPFLAREAKFKSLDNNSLNNKLSNPLIPLNVGSHTISIELPTILEDFFDLSIKDNLYPLYKFRQAAHTVFVNRKNIILKLDPSNGFMAYECIYDSWKTILKFRVARYFLHFGSGLTLSGVILTALFIYNYSPA